MKGFLTVSEALDLVTKLRDLPPDQAVEEVLKVVNDRIGQSYERGHYRGYHDAAAIYLDN